MTPDIEACSFDIEETSISKFFGSFDIEVLNFYIEVLDFDIEETSISRYFEVLQSTSISKHTSIKFDIGGGKVPDEYQVQRLPIRPARKVLAGRLRSH